MGRHKRHDCPHEDCNKRFRTTKQRDTHYREQHTVTYTEGDPSSKNWEVGCEVCGEKPTVTDTGLCGPCCFGEAATAGGNW